MKRALLLATLALAATGCVEDLYPAASAVRCVDGRAGPYHCRDLDLAALVPLSQLQMTLANDLWAWTDPADGREYVLAGGLERTTFVDVTTPTEPVVVAQLPAHGPWFFGESAWRDIKVVNDHAYIGSEALENGMQVLDLTRLGELPRRGEVLELSEDAFYAGTEAHPVGDAHNVVALPEADLVALVSTEGCNGGFHFVDVSDPLAPEFAGCVEAFDRVHDGQCVVYDGPDTEHAGRLICVAFSNLVQHGADVGDPEYAGARIGIVDVTDLDDPKTLAFVGYPDSAFSHQGWLTEDHRYLLAGDEYDEVVFGGNTRTFVWDLTDLDAPVLVDAYNHATEASDHNLYVAGSQVFQANYTAGLRVLQMRDLSQAELEEVAFFDTVPHSNTVGTDGAWTVFPWLGSGTIPVSSQHEGLFLLSAP
jgi:choice-of-anchor B domain-containing protein